MANEKKDTGFTLDSTVVYEERKRWVFFGLPFTFTKYIISSDNITINKGFFKKDEDDCYMYKVQDGPLSNTLFERMFKLGTIVCYTGDITDQKLILSHIKHSKEIKNYLLQASENARIKRRTMNMLNIGSQDLEDMDDILENE